MFFGKDEITFTMNIAIDSNKTFCSPNKTIQFIVSMLQ